ncbi:HAMP domain-containing sensor histidine kinase [Spongiactinospora sp. TRM90649]|uniref:sensor histidine kinase n=1 Tax=Spongiactinospora sp. TRM90649 TaxID=3031114 RepID=UPI0023F6A7FA|nr:HAMP domain-containing sensor histidine kinase [Spongiactinospora sp. TRM90649]MDF5757022.1 HAMP domain-containing sensor histidine kinase [Spongiactinospora sp. TRM90649]
MRHLPPFMQTIRFRLTVLYSGLLFLLAATVLGAVYYGVAASTDERPVSKEYAEVVSKETGTVLGREPVVRVREWENLINLKTLATLRRYAFVTLGGLLVASLGIGWMLSGRVLRPVRSITRAAAEIQATDLSRRIRLRGPKDELRDLADTVDTMLDRLEAGFRAQRQLIDDASHELRSPLAIIRANVDTVLTSPDSTEEERARASAIVDRATTRMTRLVEDLLATARRTAPALADADVDFGRVALEACDDFETLAAGRAMRIVREAPTGLIVIGDHDALRRAVGNLLSNAVRLAPHGSAVGVAAGRAEGWTWAAVRDQGPGLAEDDRHRVFDRFWRGETGRRDRHSGLGLAIVRQIAESHGGHVRLFSRLGVGSTFVLWLPDRDAKARTPVVPAFDPTEPARTAPR